MRGDNIMQHFLMSCIQVIGAEHSHDNGGH